MSSRARTNDARPRNRNRLIARAPRKATMSAATTVVSVTTSEMARAWPNAGSVATARRLSREPPNGRKVGRRRLEHDVGQEGRVEHPVDGEGPQQREGEGEDREQGPRGAGAAHQESSFMSERT